MPDTRKSISKPFFLYLNGKIPVPGVFRFSVFIFILLIPLLSFSQGNGNGALNFYFSKKNILLPQATSFFNVLVAENISGESMEGVVQVRQPEGWTIIGNPQQNVRLEPGEKIFFPVRIGMPRNTLGGISYLVQAEFSTRNKVYLTGSYISIERISRWDMKLVNSNVYLSDFRPVGDFSIRLENRGNSNELVRLNFDIGELLRFRTFIEADSILYVDLPAYRDTLIKFEVYKRSDLGYAETKALERNWKSTSIYIKASTPGYQSYSGVRVTPLESRVQNDLPFRNSPLNLDVTTYNLLSYQKPKASVKVHGKVLFDRNQQVQYSFGMYNLYFNPELYQNFDLYQQLRYMVRYNDSKTEVWLGDRLGTGILHTMTGSGIKASYNLNDFQSLSMNIIQNPYGKSLGTYAGYSTHIGKAALNTGLTLESGALSRTRHYSLHLGLNYSFLRNHNIRIQTATTLSRFSAGTYLENDTTAIGLAYRLGYTFNNRRFRLRLDNTNTLFTYLKNAGINRLDSDLSYKISPHSRIIGMYYRNSYLASRYPYNFYFPGNRNINENSRLIYSLSRGDIVYQAGPQFFNTTRKFYNPGSSLTTTYENFQPGFMGSVTFLIGNMKSITPNISFNTMYFKYSTNDPESEPYTITGRWSYTAGISYYDQAFRFNAYYSSGDASEIYRSVVVEDKPVISQAIHFRPSYERYFNHEKIKINAYFNYSYFMPSQRENTITNISSNFFLDNGWVVFGSLNVFRNSRTDVDLGRVTTRDLNLMGGFRKSFDVQQPRLKYYDLAIIGFNDVDGNGKKDENEKPVSNVLINLKRDPRKNEEDRALFGETKLITDPQGEIYYENIPEGRYDLEITPLSNLEDLYFLDGQNQELVADKDKIHYLPLAESYKVKGKIIVDRDPNSSFGKINLEGIRISATGENGKNYSVLTGNTGNYVLNLPKANNYTISIYNVFGDRFYLEQGSYEVQFMENKTINIDFRFREQRREIKFNGDGQLFEFQLDKNRDN